MPGTNDEDLRYLKKMLKHSFFLNITVYLSIKTLIYAKTKKKFQDFRQKTFFFCFDFITVN